MKTTEENNRLIAEFMGFKPESMVVNVAQPDGYTRAKNIIGYQIELKRADEFPNITPEYLLKYHTSWDWLMPVGARCIEKSLAFRHYPFIDIEIKEAVQLFDIQSTYKAIVKFIEWYNKQSIS